MSNAHDATSNARYAKYSRNFTFFDDPAGVIQSKDCVIVNLDDCN